MKNNYFHTLVCSEKSCTCLMAYKPHGGRDQASGGYSDSICGCRPRYRAAKGGAQSLQVMWLASEASSDVLSGLALG